MAIDLPGPSVERETVTTAGLGHLSVELERDFPGSTADDFRRAVDTDTIAGRGYSGDYCPLGRLATAQDIATVVAFLASPAAAYMTGSCR